MGVFNNLINFIFSHDPVTTAVYLFCACLAFIIFYSTLWQIIKLVYNFTENKKEGTEIVHKPIFICVDVIFSIINRICLYICGLLSGFFICLWIIWKILNLIGIGFLLYIFFPPIRAAQDLGLFNLLDRIFEINDNYFINIAEACINFLSTFANTLLDILLDGRKINPEVKDIMNNKKDNQETKNEKLNNLIYNSAPEIRIVSKPETATDYKNYTDEDKIIIKKCIKKNTKIIPQDSDTIKTLVYKKYNDEGINNCYKNFKDEKLSINPFTNLLNNLGGNIDYNNIYNNISSNMQIQE